MKPMKNDVYLTYGPDTRDQIIDGMMKFLAKCGENVTMKVIHTMPDTAKQPEESETKFPIRWGASGKKDLYYTITKSFDAKKQELNEILQFSTERGASRPADDDAVYIGNGDRIAFRKVGFIIEREVFNIVCLVSCTQEAIETLNIETAATQG